MVGFFDYLRMCMGWWSGQTSQPPGVGIPTVAVFLSIPSTGFLEEPGKRGFLSE